MPFLRNQDGMTLIELMIVVVVIGILAAIGMANYANMQEQAKVAHVKSNMHSVQLAAEDFANRNNGNYPASGAATTAEGGLTLVALLPSGGMPENPFTIAPTTLDFTNVLGSPPATDPAGGVSLNTSQSVAGGIFDTYDIVGTNASNAPLALILSNY